MKDKPTRRALNVKRRAIVTSFAAIRDDRIRLRGAAARGAEICQGLFCQGKLRVHLGKRGASVSLGGRLIHFLLFAGQHFLLCCQMLALPVEMVLQFTGGVFLGTQPGSGRGQLVAHGLHFPLHLQFLGAEASVQLVALLFPGCPDLLLFALPLGLASGRDGFPFPSGFLRGLGGGSLCLGAGDRLGALVHYQ
jgi:hypothetical protein